MSVKTAANQSPMISSWDYLHRQNGTLNVWIVKLVELTLALLPGVTLKMVDRTAEWIIKGRKKIFCDFVIKPDFKRINNKYHLSAIFHEILSGN